MYSDNENQMRWLRYPELMDWLTQCRLNVLRDLFPVLPDKPRVREKAIGALRVALARSNERLAELMTQN